MYLSYVAYARTRRAAAASSNQRALFEKGTPLGFLSIKLYLLLRKGVFCLIEL